MKYSNPYKNLYTKLQKLQNLYTSSKKEDPESSNFLILLFRQSELPMPTRHLLPDVDLVLELLPNRSRLFPQEDLTSRPGAFARGKIAAAYTCLFFLARRSSFSRTAKLFRNNSMNTHSIFFQHVSISFNLITASKSR